MLSEAVASGIDDSPVAGEAAPLGAANSESTTPSIGNHPPPAGDVGTVQKNKVLLSVTPSPLLDQQSRKRPSGNNEDDIDAETAKDIVVGTSRAVNAAEKKSATTKLAEREHTIATPDSCSLAKTLASTHLQDESDPAAKRPRVGSKDGVALSLDNGDDLTKMSAESISEFDFSSSEGEDDKDNHQSRSGRQLLTRVFDVNLMVGSIERGEAVLDQIKGRDVVLVVGKTGTGKSTLVQAIAGRTLRQTTHACRSRYGEEANKVVYETEEDALVGFEIGHAKTSRTANINCYDPREESKSSRLVYVDSPGFEDTNGHALDIATSVMFSQVAKRCRSLRFVILISYVSLLEDRGGAFRSVLKLIRTFARDFKEERQSFMFLFTHTNEIMGVPDTLEGARSCLKHEIIRTIDGTRDEDTLGILEYIHKALEKGWPFIDVFLPLATDIKTLVGTLEGQMKSSKDPHLAGTCGLSPTSRLTLAGELQNQLQHLRREIDKESPDMERITDLLKLFRYFDRYINTEDVRKSILEVDDELKKFIKDQISTIEIELGRGTLSEHDFGANNAALVKISLSRLFVLQDDFPNDMLYDDILVQMKEALTQFQAGLKLEHGLRFSEIHHHLGKLQAWADCFPDFVPLYKDMVEHLTQVINALVARARQIDADTLAGFSNDELKDSVHDLSVLRSILDNAEELSSHGLFVESATNCFNFSINGIRSVVRSWGDFTSSEMKTAVSANEHQLHILARRVRCVEALYDLIDEFPLCPKLKEETEKLRDRFEGDIIECFSGLCTEIGDTFLHSTSSDMHLKFRQLRTATELFNVFGAGRWKQMNAMYDSLVDVAKSGLKAKSGEIEEMSISAKQHGVRDGHRDAHMLEGFKSFRWFDEFLPLGDQFVGNCCLKSQHDYKDIVSRVQDEASESIRQVRDDSRESGPAVCKLKMILKEMQQIAPLALVMKHESLISIEDECRSELLHHVEEFSGHARAIVLEWNDAIQLDTSNIKAVEDASERLEYVLRESTSLLGVDRACDAILESIRLDISSVSGDFTKNVQTLLKSNGRYKKKADCLALLSILHKYAQVAPLLPEMDKLKEHVRNSVACDAKKIEDMVSETSEWDVIDGLLTKFQDAIVLDEFTSGEATSRLRPLMQIRDQKQSQVENLLDSLILEHDFKGIREFIMPYAQSKDQIKKQKFNQWRNKISSSLSSMVGIINRDLASDMTEEMCKRIDCQLQILEHAKSELGPYFKNLPGGLKLGKEINSLKAKINQKVLALTCSFKKNQTKSNYEGMGIDHHYICIISASMAKYLSNPSKRSVESTNRSYDDATKAVLSAIDRFIDSAFHDDMLHQILPTLKNASECVTPKLEDLEELYKDTSKALTLRINDAFKSISECAAERSCFYEAIEALCVLNRQLGRGLSDHLLVRGLEFDCETQLNVWRAEKQRIDREMDFDGRDASEKVKTWASHLDQLRGKSFFSKFKNILSRTTYEIKVREINTKVSDRFSQGERALKDSDYSMLNECIQILVLIEQNLGEHIPTARERSQALKKHALVSFLATCERAQRVLGCMHRRQFETVFSEYRGVVKHLPCVMMQDKAKRAFLLTNHLIRDALVSDIAEMKQLLESFDFSKLKSKVQQTRRFGGFLADRCTLLHEDVKTCKHVEGDKWLDEIFSLCLDHFSCGRHLDHIKYFAILEIPPSSTKKVITKAYKSLAKKYHPDKTGVADGVMFRRVKEASDFLQENIDFSSSSDGERPFGSLITSIRTMLREKAKTYLEEQRYDLVGRLLFRLNDLKELNALVNPPLNHRVTVVELKGQVRGYIEKARVDVDSNWSAKKYRALNDTITDLKLMEDKFKAYPDIFSSSWNNGIVEKVEHEIEVLGGQARGYLRSQQTAKKNLDGFRRCFLNMGHVLVELPLFKNHTKNVICEVLEACLSSDWGYSFLFEFGLGLQRGDENNSDEDNQVAQILVAEFSHFKEVMTMVWNEETSQKPAEDTVNGIKGYRRTGDGMRSLSVEKAQLLESFRTFEGQYKKLLGEYLKPDADLKALVQKTTAIANMLKPVNCTSGWTIEVKKEIPHILAGVFSLFTVLKSGASYNRLSDSETGVVSEKLLMKPHNIQVLTLLSIFGCGTCSSNSLDSQLMQIRTGEGKSMILGTAATVLALLGFRARCVCYSEYLSGRDYALFQDVFDYFDVTEHIKYSKITSLSEDTTATKGDIRQLTEGLLRGKLEDAVSTVGNALVAGGGNGQANVGDDSSVPQGDALDTNESKSTSRNRRKGSRRRTKKSKRETAIASNLAPGSMKEILLVDEVDVFFGSEFYGRTYNQVAQLREPEVAEILNHIWIANKRGGRRQRLVDIQALPAYSQLLKKLHGFKYLVDGEIRLMIDQVRRVDEEPYYLDRQTDRIGYKVMDSVSFEATYGYRTVFAYLQEAENGNLQHADAALARALAMPVSCGQFSYANISPERILGVSGTLSALGEYEKNVLAKYGVDLFMHVPSVYGESNFQFDKAGDGIRIETSESDYFHSITDQIQLMIKQKRSVIVFFRDNARLKKFTSSSFYRKLGRQKKLLTEELSPSEKEFVISKAATAGQVTICTAVFGRGTDFFCKDETVQRKGGVHVIQAFLSEEQSEEIQVQGRTARQGKKGSYQMILLDSDLENQFGIAIGTKDRVAKQEWYDSLSAARESLHMQRCKMIEEDLTDATQKDQDTHRYFDALLANDKEGASSKFKDIYSLFKKGSMPTSIELDLAFLVDVTGSMAPYARAVSSTVSSLLVGSGSIVAKLNAKFPDVGFQLRIGLMAYRDIDDGHNQFIESTWPSNSHFTDSAAGAVRFIQSATNGPSGGGDLAEDHLGAINRCAGWNAHDDWTSPIKFMLLLTDAPAHGMVPADSAKVANVDNYSVRHPDGLTAETVVDSLVKKDIELFICSFNPAATSSTEKKLSKEYLSHKENTEQREVTAIPMVQANQMQNIEVLGGRGKHIIFVLDMSGSMQYDWGGVVAAYNQYIIRRRQSQSDCDLVSVVQFNSSATIAVRMAAIGQAPSKLRYRGGGTAFHPAAKSACEVATATPSSHAPVIVFMSDGAAHDAPQAAGALAQLNRNVRHKFGGDIELHVVAFGGGASTTQLQQIAGASRNGTLHTSADTAELSSIFVDIAVGGNVAGVLEAEIGKRISEAVSDRLSLEYIASYT